MDEKKNFIQLVVIIIVSIFLISEFSVMASGSTNDSNKTQEFEMKFSNLNTIAILLPKIVQINHSMLMFHLKYQISQQFQV